MLSIRHISKSFGGNHVIQDVSLDFATGSLSAIIGPNGAGKTTLFNLICGSVRPDRGDILLDGQPLQGLPPRKVARRGLARAFQIASLYRSFTPWQSFCAAAVPERLGVAGLLSGFPRPEGHQRADEVVALLDLGAVAHTPVEQLSHGDQKMVDIGIALCAKPSVLLLDEPTAGMGPEERWRMVETVRRLWQTTGLTVLFIEHDMDIVFSVAQDVTVLSYGAILARGLPQTVRSDPGVIQAYLGSYAKETT
ncbi:ABC transporter ATP-binding protein [Ottowia thiooxydans]|uniref:ABC transporter ATP-binding protein n=1 Tax=Ottowia thiooxydans TaxID=219182 RepID=UPI0003F7D193|nr:ABC transporter ATP-binding protein [Ottowia thiooxydans]